MGTTYLPLKGLCCSELSVLKTCGRVAVPYIKLNAELPTVLHPSNTWPRECREVT